MVNVLAFRRGERYLMPVGSRPRGLWFDHHNRTKVAHTDTLKEPFAEFKEDYDFPNKVTICCGGKDPFVLVNSERPCTVDCVNLEIYLWINKWREEELGGNPRHVGALVDTRFEERKI